jgi:hypothetical protein
MASPFAKYQSEQVQQIAPGFVEAYGRAGASIGQGIAAVGAGIAARDDRLKEEAKLKGSLAPYLAKDKAKVEAGVKFGSLIKNPDGTVSINPESPNKDMFDTSAIEFYNQTGGDINKMEGSDLTKFAASFESKKKIEAMERETETSKVELDYKRAQTNKLNTDARLAEWEMGTTSTALGAMGFGNTPYTAGGSVIPSVQGSPAAPGAVVTPNLSSYTGTGSSLDTNGLPTYSADKAFKASLARIDAIGKRGSVSGGNFSKPDTTAPAVTKAVVDGGNFSAPTREGQLASLIAKAEASEKVAPFPKRVEQGETSEEYDAWVAASNEWTKNYGDTHIPTGSPKTARRVELDFNAANPVERAAQPATEAAPAVSSALTAGTTPTPAPAPAAEVPPVATQAETPAVAAPVEAPALPSVEQVATEVQANVQKLTVQRAAIAKIRDDKLSAMTINNEANRARTVIPLSKTELGSALQSYHTTMVEQVRKFYDNQISDVDSNIKLEESRLTTAKAAAAAIKGKADTGRAVATEGRAVAAEERAKVTAKETQRAAARQVVEESRTDLALYPQAGPFVHIGRQMIVKGKEPSKLGVNGLTDAKARSDVNELADGWIKSTDFILGMDDTLSERESMSDQDYFARMRLTTKNLNNWAEAELQQIFGVATFRKAIVSGGNFSDSDRIFVQRAIAYLNSLDPINNQDVYKAQIDALAGFVDNMYRKGLNAYGMKFDPEALEAQAVDLEKDGEPEAAEFIREQSEAGKKFMSRFNIDYKKNKVFDPEAVDAARKILWNALPASQKVDGQIKDSAPRSK